MDDDAFLTALERATFPAARFGHRAHVRLAFLYLSRHGRERGGQRMRLAIRRYATAIGEHDRYHETLTTFWLAQVADALARHRPVPDHRALLRCAPRLADPQLHRRHWSAAALASPEARRRWVPPDLAPLR